MPFTLAQPSELQELVRKSRFLARAAPIADANAAMTFLQAISDPGASHNCWAYRVGGQYRFSDDGEPGGTAGRPILAAIEAQDVDRVMVVVTRWFGGIQLGTGGLARAYGGIASRCLQKGEQVALRALVSARCRCTFAEHGLIRARLAEFETELTEEIFVDDGVSLTLAVPPERLAALHAWLADLSRGRIGLQR